ncbi:MAG: hypothetical protein IH589_17870 [Anaerolineales bacterium]|nr:hypothetical protein [Anaerolineales bacterium]
MDNINGLLVSIVVAILTAFATGFVTSWGYWRQAKAQLEKEYQSRFNTKKWEVYTEFTKLLHGFLINNSVDLAGATQQQNEIVLASQLVLIGSDEVVRSFRDWRESSMAYGKSHAVAKEKLFNLVVKMRNDLGIKYSKLALEDLLGALEPGFAKS